jgi:hypothetical protein
LLSIDRVALRQRSAAGKPHHGSLSDILVSPAGSYRSLTTARIALCQLALKLSNSGVERRSHCFDLG